MAKFEFVNFGSEAIESLRKAVADAKDGDPLAPVTVVVGSNISGLHLRRRLIEAGENCGDAPGISNVRFTVLRRTAELLAESRMPNKLRLTPPVARLAARQAMSSVSTPLSRYSGSGPTVASVARVLMDLRRAPSTAIDQIPTHRSYLGELYGEWARIWSPHFFDEEEVFKLAAEAVLHGDSVVAEMGKVVLFLPEPARDSERRLYQAFDAFSELKIIIGLTGDSSDGEAAALAQSLGYEGEIPEIRLASAEHRCAVLIDAREEVRFVVSKAVQLAQSGISLHRIAILTSNPKLYAPLIDTACETAGLPVHGKSTQALNHFVMGRALKGFLVLSRRTFPRQEVIDWISSAPFSFEGKPVDAALWDRLTRAAGITRGKDRWKSCLGRIEAELRRPFEGADPRSAARAEEADEVARIGRFIDELDRRLVAPQNASWHDAITWILDSINDFIDPASFSPVEASVRTLIVERIRALVDLERLLPTADMEALFAAVEEVLSSSSTQTTRYGSGIYRGRLSDAMQLDFDHVFVVGMVEGVLPARFASDPVFPDSERPEGIPLKAPTESAQRRSYCAVKALGGHITFCTSRVDRGRQREQLPSLWFLEEASSLAKRSVYSSDLPEHMDQGWLEMPMSLLHAFETHEPGTVREYDIKTLLASEVASHPLIVEDTFQAGIRMQECRLSEEWTDCDGIVGPTGWVTSERTFSPSALEMMAACPHRFFFSRILRLRETEDPQVRFGPESDARGRLIHDILARYIDRTIAGEVPSEELMLSIVDQEFERFENEENTGPEVLWRNQKAKLRENLRKFVAADQAFRSESGAKPLKTEWSFGSEAPCKVTIGDHPFSIRGRIDRIDSMGDGISVIDYKTGKKSFRLDEDPLQKGTLIQLPLYGMAAAQELGYASVASRAYWTMGEKGKWDRAEQSLSDDEWKAFEQNLVDIAEAIEQGIFPARPGKASNGTFENCGFCPFDRVCPADRDVVWQRKINDPRVANLVAIETRTIRAKEQK